MSTAAEGWQAVIPLKNLGRAKSRLELPPPVRRDLVVGFAQDVIDACVQTGMIDEILVVADRSWNAEIPPLAAVVPDSGHGLNHAIATAASVPTAQPRRLVIMGDLPCATGGELAGLLQAAPTDRMALVADHLNSGTTVLMGPSAVGPAAGVWGHTRFGRESFVAHMSDGGVDLTPTVGMGLRWDVDDHGDLIQAVRLGVGAHTSAALAAHDL